MVDKTTDERFRELWAAGNLTWL